MTEQQKPAEDANEATTPEQEPVVQETAVEGEVESATEASEGPSEAEQIEQLQAKLADVQKALDEADVRAQAEIQNVRRRAERDVSHAHKFAVEKFANDMLAVADNLERGLAAMPEDDESLKAAREGVELTLKVLLDTFTKHQIEQINPKDEPFNPEQHEAMTMVPVPGVAANTVIDVLEKGYLLNGRLIRPARVVVSKGE